MPREDYRFFSEVPTRWGDADMLGHINNVLYVRYLETNRLDYMHQVVGIDVSLPVRMGIVIADLKISFLQQAHHPAVFEVGSRISRLGNSSFDIESEIFTKGEDSPVIRALAVCVWFNFIENNKEPIPRHVREILFAYERVKPL